MGCKWKSRYKRCVRHHLSASFSWNQRLCASVKWLPNTFSRARTEPGLLFLLNPCFFVFFEIVCFLDWQNFSSAMLTRLFAPLLPCWLMELFRFSFGTLDELIIRLTPQEINPASGTCLSASWFSSSPPFFCLYGNDDPPTFPSALFIFLKEAASHTLLGPFIAVLLPFPFPPMAPVFFLQTCLSYNRANLLLFRSWICYDLSHHIYLFLSSSYYNWKTKRKILSSSWKINRKPGIHLLLIPLHLLHTCLLNPPTACPCPSSLRFLFSQAVVFGGLPPPPKPRVSLGLNLTLLPTTLPSFPSFLLCGSFIDHLV